MNEMVYQFMNAAFYTLKNLPRDLNGLVTLTKLKKKLKQLDTRHENVEQFFAKWVRQQPDKACIIFNDTTWTFRDMENYANKVANRFREQGLKKGDVVALIMENRPEYIGIWYGLSKLGVITACINTNLTRKPLTHSINVAKPKVVIVDSVFAQNVTEIKGDLENKDLDYVIHGDIVSGYENLDQLLETIPHEFSPDETVTGQDVLMYIYTSGTTGLPKPAIIKHSRYIGAGFTFFDTCQCNKSDVFLVTLPIYHSNAGMIGVGATMISGATVVLRRKFSATNFWKECIQNKVTAFTYVGEVCRYLVNQPVSPIDKAHSVRLCIGNGTRANIHKQFTERFNVKVMEFYGATEGNCVLINNIAKTGACGYLPRINGYLKFLPTYLIKVDENIEPIRNSAGFCIACSPNEKGLLVGVIDPTQTRQQFSGYANQTEASQKKVIHNLFRTGQAGFNTGDVCMSDKDGFIYFCDRVGDTFRWRGENVSTVEVENIISSRLDFKEVVVYGVEINGQEGKAGMATIVSTQVDVDKLANDMSEDLPAYARPLFLRLTETVDHTGSLKAQKNQLVKDSFNINVITDKTFYFDGKLGTYVELTQKAYDDIQNGNIRM